MCSTQCQVAAITTFTDCTLYMLQVHKAFVYLEKSQDADKPDVRYAVRVRRPDGSTSGRGIYLREPLDTVRKVTFMAEVHPTFHEASKTDLPVEVAEKQPPTPPSVEISSSPTAACTYGICWTLSEASPSWRTCTQIFTRRVIGKVFQT